LGQSTLRRTWIAGSRQIVGFAMDKKSDDSFASDFLIVALENVRRRGWRFGGYPGHSR
jgi:hypothetical protein